MEGEGGGCYFGQLFLWGLCGRKLPWQLFISCFDRNTPFNKEELASILKFGAEELFKEGDGEQDAQLQVMIIYLFI